MKVLKALQKNLPIKFLKKDKKDKGVSPKSQNRKTDSVYRLNFFGETPLKFIYLNQKNRAAAP